MPTNTPASSPAKPEPVAPKPERRPASKPVLGPYEITKGRTIPNEPKTGPYPRDTTHRKSR